MEGALGATAPVLCSRHILVVVRNMCSQAVYELWQDLKVANHALANELVRMQTHGGKVGVIRVAEPVAECGDNFH